MNRFVHKADREKCALICSFFFYFIKFKELERADWFHYATSKLDMPQRKQQKRNSVLFLIASGYSLHNTDYCCTGSQSRHLSKGFSHWDPWKTGRKLSLQILQTVISRYNLIILPRRSKQIVRFLLLQWFPNCLERASKQAIWKNKGLNSKQKLKSK